MNENIKKISPLLIIIALFLLLQFPFLDSVKKIIVDESWYANVGYNFSQGRGFINTNVGAFGGDICFLYPVIQGIFFFVFGTSLFVARLVSISAGVAAIIGLYSLFSYLNIRNGIKYFSLAVLVLSYNYYLVFRFARPEAWVFAFFVWVVYFQVKYWEEQKNKYILLTGLFIGLAILTHPWSFSFGLLFGIYYIILSIKKKDIKILLLFVSCIIPVFLIMLLNMTLIGGMSLSSIMEKMQYRSSVMGGNSSYLSRVKFSFMDLFGKFGLQGGRFYLILFQAIISFYGLTFYKKNIRIFRFSLLQILLTIIIILFYNGIATEYTLHLIFLFTFLNLAILLNEENITPIIKKVIFALSLLFLINNIFGIYTIVKKDYGESYSSVSSEIKKNVPESVVVLSPIELWFPLRNCEFYNSNASWDFANYIDLNKLLESGRIDYIIKSDGIAYAQTEENLLAMDKYISDKGNLTYTLVTKNYGNITVWKIKK